MTPICTKDIYSLKLNEHAIYLYYIGIILVKLVYYQHVLTCNCCRCPPLTNRGGAEQKPCFRKVKCHSWWSLWVRSMLKTCLSHLMYSN